MFTLLLHGQWDSDLVSDIHIMDGVTEVVTGATLHMVGVTQDIGDQDGAIQDTDLITDTITTLIAMEEEVLLLITEEETMDTTEAIATETTAIEAIIATETLLTEIIATETILQTEEVTPQTDKTTDILTLEEVLQTEEHTILQAQLLQTEEVMRKGKAIAMTILTEDRPIQIQQEATITAATTHQQEVTLLAHLVL